MGHWSVPAIFWLLTYLLTRATHPKKLKGPEDRLKSIYHHVARSHRKNLRRLGLYQLVTSAIPLMGWIAWMWGETNHHPFFLRTDGVLLCFAPCFILFVALIGLGRKLDQAVAESTLKGVQIERRLKKAHDFRRFFRKRRGIFLGIYKIYRITPLMSLLYPLLFHGLCPWVAAKVGNLYFVFAQMVAMGVIGLLFIVMTPFMCRAYSSSRGPLSLLNHQ